MIWPDDTRRSALRSFTAAELEEELGRRRADAGQSPKPAFACDRCGATGHYVGVWSAHSYERQHDRFFAGHADCPLSIEGGGI